MSFPLSSVRSSLLNNRLAGDVATSHEWQQLFRGLGSLVVPSSWIIRRSETEIWKGDWVVRAATANWGTSHAGTGNEKPSVVEARRVWGGGYPFSTLLTTAQNGHTHSHSRHSEWQSPLQWCRPVSRMDGCHGPGRSDQYVHYLYTHGSTLTCVLEWKARLDMMEVTAVSLGALPRSQLPCPVMSVGFQIKFQVARGYLPLGCSLTLVPSMDDGCGCQEL